MWRNDLFWIGWWWVILKTRELRKDSIHSNGGGGGGHREGKARKKSNNLEYDFKSFSLQGSKRKQTRGINISEEKWRREEGSQERRGSRKEEETENSRQKRVCDSFEQNLFFKCGFERCRPWWWSERIFEGCISRWRGGESRLWDQRRTRRGRRSWGRWWG